MRKVCLRTAVPAFLFLMFCFNSCVDGDYKWKDISKEAVVQIPPLLLGSLDTLWIKDLVEVPEFPFGNDGLPLEINVVFSHTIDNLFGEKAVKYFFHPYVSNDVSLVALADVKILSKDSGPLIEVTQEVLDENYNKLDRISLPPSLKLQYGKDQQLGLIYPQDQIPFMSKAHHLKLYFAITIPITDAFADDDYICLRKLTLKTGGIYFDKW